jgi:hypothetical protein
VIEPAQTRFIATWPCTHEPRRCAGFVIPLAARTSRTTFNEPLDYAIAVSASHGILDQISLSVSHPRLLAATARDECQLSDATLRNVRVSATLEEPESGPTRPWRVRSLGASAAEILASGSWDRSNPSSA